MAAVLEAAADLAEAGLIRKKTLRQYNGLCTAVRNDFHARGLASQEHFDSTGTSYSTKQVLATLRVRTQRRRKQLAGR